MIKTGESGRQKDCARAAGNDVLKGIRDKLELDGASNGACDKAPNGFGGKDGCQANVRKSLEGWEEQLEARYDECVDATFFGTDPSLHYWDIDVPVAAQKKFVFTIDPDCSHDDLGCLFGAELRPFCDIQSFNTLMSCEMAGNDRDPNADAGMDPDTSGGGGGGVVEPFGDIGSLTTCSPQTTCTVHDELRYNVEYNFFVFWEEGVLFTLSGAQSVEREVLPNSIQ